MEEVINWVTLTVIIVLFIAMMTVAISYTYQSYIHSPEYKTFYQVQNGIPAQYKNITLSQVEYYYPYITNNTFINYNSVNYSYAGLMQTGIRATWCIQNSNSTTLNRSQYQAPANWTLNPITNYQKDCRDILVSSLYHHCDFTGWNGTACQING